VSGRSRPSCGGHDRDAQVAAAAAKVAEGGDGPGVGAVQIVKQQRERRMLSGQRDEAAP